MILYRNNNDNNQLFNFPIETFNWDDLNGKELRIGVSQTADGVVVVGVEKSTGKIYVLVTDINFEGMVN
jgi:hypothetical protein